jgi:hypothetical protein
MSTKTLRKRIALVAVVALGAGVLATSPASAADNAAVSANNVAFGDGVLNVVTKASLTGDAIVSVAALTANNASRSLGLLANSTTQVAASLTSTATMRSDGEIAFHYQASAVEKAVTVVVTGGTITDFSGKDVTATSASTTNMNAAKTQLTVGTITADKVALAFAFTPSSGSTAGTVSVYESAALAAYGNATELASIQSGATSKGTLKQYYAITVATTSVSGAYSSTYSTVAGQACGSLSAPASNTDVADSLSIANSASAVACISIDLKDAYNVSLDSVGALVVTGTNGAGIKYTDSYATGTPLNITDVSNDTSGTITVARPAAFANKAFTTTVTITWNGAVVGTKTVKFQGEVAKIVVTSDLVGQAGASNAALGTISYEDSAGNVLLPSSGTAVVSTSLNSFVTAASVSAWASAGGVDYPYSDYDVACAGTTGTGADAGSADLVWQHTNASGTVVKSAAVKVSCAGNPATYTASFDKAVYAPGDIATLTITFKDSKGNLANGYKNIQSTTAGSEFAVTTPSNLTIVTAISTSSVKASTAAGVKTYKYIVGTTEGSFQAVVSAPTVNALLLGGANQTAAYKVAAASTGVTNADVLKAIVSLIASINKQIAALQKALLKK